MNQEWLQNLEEKVQQTAQRLRDVREENEQLEARCKELESKVEDLETQLLEAAGDEGGAEWREERDEIRTRVEKLVDHLGELLAE
ncbi:MAG: cell division protein ZapB [Acidobacteriota bacterium]